MASEVAHAELVNNTSSNDAPVTNGYVATSPVAIHCCLACSFVFFLHHLFLPFIPLPNHHHLSFTNRATSLATININNKTSPPIKAQTPSHLRRIQP
jgi:hypothetical protein